MKGLTASLAFVLILLLTSSSPGQVPADSLLQYFRFDETPPFNCLFTLFPTLFIENGVELKQFIRSRTFRDIRKQFGDIKAADAIYVRAMQMTENNAGVALLISAIACFDHKMVGLNVPVLSLFFPLTGESDEEFARRVRRLPTKLYSDTPGTPEGDRDKLQHFLGSAFLSYTFESRGTAMRFGEFVEKGEDAFIIGGVNDDRDLRADMQGGEFGLALLENNRRLPSEFLKVEMASVAHQRQGGNYRTCCMGAW